MRLKPRLFRKPRKGHWATKSLICFPLMNEGSGNTVQDLSGNGKTGTLIATATWTPTIKYSPGIVFDGDSDYIQIISGHQLTKYTHEIYFIPGADTTTKPISGIAEEPGHAVCDRIIFIDAAGKFSHYIFDGAEKYTVSTTAAQTGVPVHIVGTADGVNIKIYINGVLEDTTAAGNAFTGYTSPEYIIGYLLNGTFMTPAQYSDGTVLLARNYNRALSASEIALLYREPFIMFERDPIELWTGATSVGVPPVGAAGIMTTNTGYWGPTF